ncbi:Stp1/IreP family PP2C-type Ser/Thr phosphatase [Leucobacter sp. CSA1]|uniref:Stp1/IreP family PP2C-type Ser/Thr phosphatase n=1 Tax=Leucobacter chromiisoli TaxID=2796471 RepID=A0A934QAT2_9MICO|nr:Stp1/IreP family PP2C-type Ser/Thr phosphatase [Leucobacter chromiisoli]MBK0420331.1 Stp1/IreP family PP2C-type Ser/Thr phosphatase [Leucobacter chromiisoli]
MTVAYASAIGSHVGMVRSNNQDSGFAGDRLFLVADGMGGHAGGDVASALTTKAMAELDAESTGTPEESARLLRKRLIETNRMLRSTVGERPELSGMGTTFSGFLTVGDQLALAHIGDSRLYLLRDDKLQQITKDHTFVQRLVDSGRITEEEAKTHPRRSVLMRVLGDVDSSPEVDTKILDTRPGDVWLLCSDGLCGYVEETDIEKIMRRGQPLQRTVDDLIDKALSHGAPDNVTVVLVEAKEANAEDTQELPPGPRFAGSAASEIPGGEPVSTARTRLLGRKRVVRRVQPVAESHFEPRVDEYLAELIAETKRRNRRRRLLWLLGVVGILAALTGAIALGYQWTQTRYFVGVGTETETVVIYRGVQQSVGPFSLHSVAEDTGIPVEDLDGLGQRQVERTLSAGSIEEARDIVTRLGVDDE